MPEKTSTFSGQRPRELQPLDIGPCYHCDTKALTNVYCDLWRVWACKSCLTTHHRAHHEDCRGPALHGVESFQTRSRTFVLWLTRYDGHLFSLTCRLGLKIEMEDHWLGTYVFLPGAMILVLEQRGEINSLILDALRRTNP